jgi:PilZ domain
MNRVAVPAELRKNPRAQLRLPTRLRWRGPLGMRLETAHTVNVSRTGMLLSCLEGCDVDSRVWVAFPFEKRATSAQPETPATVVRVTPDKARGYRVALKFDAPPASAAPFSARRFARERRGSTRVRFALPIFVRAANSPWPEESMTQDVSRAGARFESAQIYAAGDHVLAKIPWGDFEKTGEMNATIVRVEPAAIAPGPSPLANPASGASAILNTICIRWEHPATAPTTYGARTASTASSAAKKPNRIAPRLASN